MADQAVALDAHLAENGVVVAVGGGIGEAQAVAAGLALGPQLVAGAAVEGYVAGLKRLVERLLVHEAQHENLAVVGILNDGRGESPHLFKIDLHCPFPRWTGLLEHPRAAVKRKNPLGSIAPAGQCLDDCLLQGSSAPPPTQSPYGDDDDGGDEARDVMCR